jgi:murein DD-endopeptidase MepM/ murein hydrolase activator NlpD
MADNIPSLDDLLKNIQEEGDDNIPGLDDLLESIKNEDAPRSSSALAVVPKKPEDLVEEDIDSQILSILGLEDVFDLTYEEYASLLKEASVKARMPGSQMSTESVELITDEFKRVRNKTGRFKVKPKKVDINKVLDRKQPTPPGAIVKAEKLIPTAPEVSPEQQKTTVDTENLQGDLIDGIGNILESLITIRTLLQSQGKIEQKSAQEDRKETEKKKKKEREATLEKKKPKLPIIKSLTKPVDDFFSAIKRFFTNVLLGSVVLGMFKWLKDPKNQKAIDDFTNFIENNLDKIFNGILALIGLRIGWNVFKWTRRLYKAFDFLKNKLPGGKPKPSASGAPTGGVKPGVTSSQSRPPAGSGGAKITGSGGEVIRRGLPKGGGARGGVGSLIVGTVLGSAMDKFISQPIEQKILDGKINQYKSLPEEKKSEFRNSLVQRIFEQENSINSPANKLNRAMETLLDPVGAATGTTTTMLERDLARNLALYESIKEVDEKIEQKQKLKVKPQTPKTTDYVSPFAGARDREILKASKITGNAPITIGEKASAYSVSRGRPHRGRDIAAPSGTGLTVPSESVITDKGVEGGYGNYVVFKDSSGVEHFYGHMIEQSPLNVGDTVSPGDIIGRVGSTGQSTGPHLHWEVSRVMGEVGRPRANVIDPIEMGFPAQAPFTGKVESSEIAKIAKTPVPTPSIPSPTGRGNIVPLPIPVGGGQQQISSGSAPNQAPVSRFSSEDPNNATTMVVRAIYNIVG